MIDGTAWTIGGYVAMQVFRFAFNVALAQIVAPKIFGVMALVSLFLQGLQMFSDLGIRQCVIQHPRGDEPAFLNTAWTIQALRGMLLWIGTLLLAWPIAAFYEEPALAWLIPLSGLSALIYGFSSTAMMTYSREVRRGPLVRRELGVYVITYSSVVAAVELVRRQWPGGEAMNLELGILGLGMVVAALGEVMLSYTLTSLAPHRFAWDPEARRELLHFGGWVFLSSTCTFCAAQADRLIVGKLSLETLGVYHIAVVIAALPAGVLAALGIHLVYPLMSDALRDGEPLSAAFRRAHRGLIAAAGLLIVGMACIGPAFVRLIYDERYSATAEYVRLLAVAAWFTALLVPGELTLLAMGNTRGLATAQFVRLICIPCFLVGGYWLGGLPGLILGVACGELVRYVVIAVFLHSAGIRVFPADAAITILSAVVLGLYVTIERAAGSRGWVAVPAIGAILQGLLWVGVYVVWSLPARWPRALEGYAVSSRTTPDGIKS
jgi:O-antigen/teichoic acid export membrane protein